MCVPLAAVAPVVTLATSAVSAVNGYKESSRNAKYQTQAAIANMENARKIALEQKQTGIEEARKEKLQGIQKASMLMASNAANGFSVDSDTNQYNLSSIYDYYDDSANNIQNRYNSSSDSYFAKSAGYFNQANQISQKTNENLYSIAIAGLGNSKSVASRWYSAKSS